MTAESDSGAASVREIACDESGSEGDRLVGGNTAVFAHAGVWLSVDAAAACIAEVRARVRSPAVEYKANHLLRGKHRQVLEWLLGPAGPLLGHAHVYVVEKAFVVVLRLVEYLTDGSRGSGDAHTRGVAMALYRAGPGLLGPDGWAAFLDAANDVLRRRGVELDPLPLAVERAVLRWSRDGTLTTIIHDRQNALTTGRIARLGELPGLAGFRFEASSADPRIQVADFVAGVARAVAEKALTGDGDPIFGHASTSLYRSGVLVG